MHATDFFQVEDAVWKYINMQNKFPGNVLLSFLVNFGQLALMIWIKIVWFKNYSWIWDFTVTHLKPYCRVSLLRLTEPGQFSMLIETRGLIHFSSMTHEQKIWMYFFQISSKYIYCRLFNVKKQFLVVTFKRHNQIYFSVLRKINWY